ncbi:MAG: hypothetical protein R6T98_08190 [Desulfatiglandales bacterium]
MKHLAMFIIARKTMGDLHATRELGNVALWSATFKYFFGVPCTSCLAVKAKLALKRSDSCLCNRFTSTAGYPEKYLKVALHEASFPISMVA